MTTTTDRARQMRSAMSPPEARLWVALRRLRADGFHFRRQVPFRGYFLDFACHDRRLVVEVDGAMHDFRIEHDRTRDGALAREEYRTLRYSNADIRDNLEGVMMGIRTALAAHGPTRIADAIVPPHKGGGE